MALPTCTFPAVFQGTLHTVYPQPNDRYKLLIYASRESQPHASFNEVVSVPSTNGNQFSFRYCVGLQAPHRLYFVLFVTRPDKGGLICQFCLAWGLLPWPEGSTGLVDVKGQVQAQLRIACLTPKLTAHNHQAQLATHFSLLSTANERLLQQVREAYRKFDYETNSFLCWVVTPMGKMPVLPFVAATTSILPPGRTDQLRSQLFLQHAFRVAGNNTRLSLKGWSACNSVEQARWLVEMVTLLPRALIYQQDVVRTGKGLLDVKPADQWMRLLGIPDLHVAGYDCEDSALLCLEILHLLKRTEFQDPMLQQVQQMVRAYTACFVFGTLLIEDKYSPHAYAALLPVDFLDRPPGLSKQPFPPAIVFEGTARIGGSWKENASTQDPFVDESFEAHTHLLSLLPEDRGFSRIIRSPASMEMVRRRGVFGQVFGLIAPDHAGHAVHWLLHEAGKKNIGVPVESVFACASNVRLHRAASLHNPSQIEAAINELPQSHIPTVFEANKSWLSQAVGSQAASAKFHMDCHYESYKQNKEAIDAALASLRKLYRITTHEVQLTDQLRVVQFWFA